ncbi:calcium/sodium antiporter [Woodsholea maritima]|uniref:calcium/sodium antiporter n=1 Tax=Woodsholea maritima TaxID=240237 RepID=UPI00036FD10E|nr:calcium/sodium antiporter [Woodsholea maritima]
MITDLIMLAIGIVVLIVGGDFLVRGATALARNLGIPPLIVGLTIVAFGTSAPEMVVSAAAALSNAPGLALGNIVGSNIANILLVLGLPAILAPMAVTTPGIRTNALIVVGASALFIGLTWDRGLSLIDGAILAAGIVAYILYLALHSSKAKDDPILAELTDIDHMEGLPKSGPMLALFILGGLIALPIGAHLIVTGGASLATDLGVPEAVVGLTVLALGTSLPELSTAIMAAMRKNADMALGNVLGSNIFNIFAVGGITGLAAGAKDKIAVVDESFFALDYWVMLGAAIAVTLFIFTRRPITRLAGMVLFLAYCLYIGALGLGALA